MAEDSSALSLRASKGRSNFKGGDSLVTSLFAMIFLLFLLMADGQAQEEEGRPTLREQQKTAAETAEKEEKAAPVVVESDINFDPLLQKKMNILEPHASFAQFVDKPDLSKIDLTEDYLIQLNSTLRRMIEENEKLRQANDAVAEELNNVRGQRNLEARRRAVVAQERDAFRQESLHIISMNKQYRDSMKKNRFELEAKENWLRHKVKSVAAQEKQVNEVLAQKETDLQTLQAQVEVFKQKYEGLVSNSSEQMAASGKRGSGLTTGAVGQARAGSSQMDLANLGAVQDVQEKSQATLNLIEQVNEENDRLRTDQGRLHYNMGNVFYRQGKYGRALKEFKQAVKFTPEDANAHFNLAFVSSDYMQDFSTALKHYKQYLFLNPRADDKPLVEEKILEAELKLRTTMNSSLEDDMRKDKQNWVDKR